MAYLMKMLLTLLKVSVYIQVVALVFSAQVYSFIKEEHITLRNSSEVILSCPNTQQSDPGSLSNCRTWVFEKQGVNGKPDKIYHLNSDIETGLFWYDDSDPNLRCRVRKPRAEWESALLHNLELIGWQYDWMGFFDGMNVSCYNCRGDCNANCTKRGDLITRYILNVDKGQQPDIASSGCPLEDKMCNVDNFVNVSYHLCQRREYCRVPLDGLIFNHCSEACSTFINNSKHEASWGHWSLYSPSTCDTHSPNCQEGFLCRYRVCNSPYPLPNKSCAGDPEGLHYSLELRSCLDGQTCKHVSTDSSFVVVAVLINIAVIMAISIVVILSCGGPSDELVEMRRLVKKGATGMKGSKLRGL